MKKVVCIVVHFLLTLVIMTGVTMLLKSWGIGNGAIYNGLMILILVISYGVYKKYKDKI